MPSDVYTLRVDHQCLLRFDGHLCMLHCAINAQNSNEIAHGILAQGLCLGARNWAGQTALHTAAACGKTDIVLELLSRGLRVDEEDYDDNTPLFLATVYGHLSAFEALISAGADVNHRNNGGWFPSHAAAAYNRVEILRFMAELSETRFVEFDRPNKQDLTPFQLADIGLAREAMRLLLGFSFIEEKYRDSELLVAV